MNIQYPKGQFTALWLYGGEVWSADCSLREGKLYRYNEDEDCFNYVDPEWCPWHLADEVKFITQEEFGRL